VGEVNTDNAEDAEVNATAVVTKVVVHGYNGGSGGYYEKYTKGLALEQATGNFAMAQGTLMGELGPELVVSNGHYFVAG
jgi:hypothetical protein